MTTMFGAERGRIGRGLCAWAYGMGNPVAIRRGGVGRAVDVNMTENMNLLLDWIGTIALTIGAIFLGYIIGRSPVREKDREKQE